MPYIGNSHNNVGEHVNNFKVLDDISSYTATFDGSATGVVSTTNETIRVADHRFLQGQRVTYNNGGGSNIGGLTSGTAYYISLDTANTVKLATSLVNANNNTVINLSSVGSGSSHTLTAAFDGVNKEFKLTYGTKAAIVLTAPQLNIAINNVIQRPNLNPLSFTEGFAVKDGNKIIFQSAPQVNDVFWGSITSNSVSVFDVEDNAVDNFTGDGSTTNFTLSAIPPNKESILVTLDGVVQHPSDNSTTRAYTIDASVVVFTSAPASGVLIQVRHIGFASPTTPVRSFYGRTGNVTLNNTDDIVTRNINSSGIITASSFSGTFSGAISGTSATFSGDVSIGGTLTYEDVKNVDSVGFITARSGILVQDDATFTGAVGNMVFDKSDSALEFGDSLKASFGNSNDLQIVHQSGENHFLLNSGNTFFKGDVGWGVRNASNQNIIQVSGSSRTVDLYGSTLKVLSTTGVGVTIRQGLYIENAEFNMTTNGNKVLDFETGGSNGVYFRHNPSDSGNTTFIKATHGGSLELYDDSDGNVKLTTQSSGVFISGALRLQGTESSYITGQAQPLIYRTGSTSGSYPFNNYGHLVIQTRTDGSSTNRDIIFATGTGSANQIIINSSGHVVPGADSTYDLGLTGTRFRNVYADTLYGDGSNLTGIAADKIFEGNTEVETVDTGTNGHVKITTEGSERLRIDSSGRLIVGGGTDPAESTIVAKGNSTSATSYSVLDMRRGQAATSAGDVLGYIRFSDTNIPSSNNNYGLIFGACDGASSGAGDNPGRLVFSTTADGASGPTERLRIDSEGIVTVNYGNATSNAIFKIAKDSNGEAQLRFETASANTASIVLDSAEQLKFKYGGTEVLRIDSNGRLQIGSSTSTSYNQFNGTGRLNINNNSADGTVDFTQGIVFTDNTNNSGTWTHGAIVCVGSTGYNGSMVFGTDGNGQSTSNITEKMRITHDGKIGINDTAPERTMDVRGSNCMIQLEGTGGSGRQWSLCSTDNATGTGVDGGPSGSFAIYDDTDGQARLRIDSSGNARFLVSGGSFTAEGTGAYGISIHNTNSPSMGHLFIYGDNGLIRFRNNSSVYTAQMGYTESNNTMFFANQEGGTTMYINADGVQLFDNNKFLCGNDKDLEIYHNNSNAFIKNATGYTMYRAGQHVFENSNGATEMFRIKSDGRIGINANPSVNHEYLHIKPVGNNVLDLRYELNSDTDIRHKFFDNTGTQRGTFGYTTYANDSTYPNFHDSFYMQTDPGSNGTLATALRISNTGQFIKPLTYKFLVETNGTSVSGGWNKLTGLSIDSSYSTGVSNGTYWSNSNQRFTAPVSGTYLFFIGGFSSTAEGGGTNHRYMYVFQVNGSGLKYGFGGNYSDNNTPMAGGAMHIPLNVNDYVEVQYYTAISATWGAGHRFFWGGYFLG